jgi:hypothetical protein
MLLPLLPALLLLLIFDDDIDPRLTAVAEEATSSTPDTGPLPLKGLPLVGADPVVEGISGINIGRSTATI